MTHSAAPANRRTTACEAGLRERKKRRTRDALARAAVELFTTQGYEATTVDAIAARVDVSQRTFFRYFAGKEDAAFVVDELVEEMFAGAVRDRPAHEPPLAALRGAILETWEDVAEAANELLPFELHMRMYQLVESTPALMAGRLRRQARLDQLITDVVAHREGLDPCADPRPRVLAAAFSGVVRAASQSWGRHADNSPEAVRQAIKEHLAVFGPELLGAWRTG